MDKESGVHMHNGISLSHKKTESVSVVVKWMNLVSLAQTDVSQKEKN